jgi:catechol 2,3-dioxygenase-like lactoylglutathione lyase family enzyme
MDILWISSVSLISSTANDTRDLFVRVLGLPLKPASVDADYVFSEKVEGAKHFGVWPLAQAAEACFGTPEWPKDRVVPQLSIELELRDEAAVAAGAAELQAKGYTLLHGSRKEPWGQTVCRMLTVEGVILGLSYAPWQHGEG